MKKIYIVPIVLLLSGYTNTLQAQSTLSGTGGAKIVISAGTTLNAHHVAIDGTSTEIVNTAGTLKLTGNFTQTNTAVYTASGTGLMELVGTAQQTIDGNATINIPRLTLNNTAGAKLATADVNVATALTITTGDLDLRSRNVDLGSAGILSEDRVNNHLVVDNTSNLNESNKGGYVRVTNRATTGILAQIAGLGVHLANAGTVSIDRFHFEGAGIAGGGVLKNYEIIGTPTNAIMRIEFATDELGGITPDNTFKLFRYNGTTWVNQGGTWTNAAVDYVELANINAFSPWTTGSGSGPLPVSLMKFEVQRLDNQRVVLNWQTALEVNNKGFEVEQSDNGTDFQKIAFVDGRVNSNTIQQYNHIAIQPLSAYYRLKQLDLDGKFSYSPIRFVGAGESQAGFGVSPNPSISKLQRVRLRFEQGASNEVLHLILYDAQGKLVWESKGKLADLEDEINATIPQQANGLLYLRLQSRVGSFEQKMVKY
jgi:hypothetical protein